MISSRSMFAATVLVAAAPAQLTLTDGNMNVGLGAIPATAQLPASLSLRADALATNHGFEQGWFYRVNGDAREFALRTLGGMTEGLVGTDHGNRDFANIDSRNLLKAAVDYDVYDSGPASGVAFNRLTLTNRSNAPVTVNVFCYTDLDIAATSGNDVCTGGLHSHFVTDGSGVQIEVRALGNDLTAVAAYPTLRTLLTNAAVDNLLPAFAPFAGDYTGAFQWQNRTLQPFEQSTFTVVFCVDTAAAALPLVEHYGIGNGYNFEIYTDTIPLQDNTQVRVIKSQMKNALPSVEQRTIFGLDPWVPQPYIPGLDFWVLPASIIGVYGFMTSPQGTAEEAFLVPPAPYFNGINIYFQVFSVDAAAPNGFAYFTPGMRFRIGKL
jgi:hypothetical protein